MSEGYVFEQVLSSSIEEASDSMKLLLAEQGFSVLFEIPIHEKIKAKTGKEIQKNVILGVCNPEFALDALEKEPSLSALLPCNVFLREEKGRTITGFADPEMLIELSGKKELSSLAKEVKERLRNVLEAIE